LPHPYLGLLLCEQEGCHPEQPLISRDFLAQEVRRGLERGEESQKGIMKRMVKTGETVKNIFNCKLILHFPGHRGWIISVR
jgi:hypothetical protein